MASLARGAPLPLSRDALVAEQRFQDLVQRSRSLAHKILQAIPGTHGSCVYTESLELNSTENAKLGRIAIDIRLPTVPALKFVSENVTLEQSLRLMYEGLQLHSASLSSVSLRLDHKSKVTDLLNDIRDLALHINKMLKMAQAESTTQPSAGPADLHLPSEYEVQVAAHLTLVQLQAFGKDLARGLRILDQSDEEEEENYTES